MLRADPFHHAIEKASNIKKYNFKIKEKILESINNKLKIDLTIEDIDINLLIYEYHRREREREGDLPFIDKFMGARKDDSFTQKLTDHLVTLIPTPRPYTLIVRGRRRT